MTTAGLRTRWAAIGAAIAVAVGGGVGLIADAAGGGAPSSLINIVPCRLMDTRPGADNVGPRSTPLAADTPYVATVWGANGNCTIPSTAVGVVMNVTAVNPTAGSFLSIYPADSSRPLVSSLNYEAGQPPTPNGVTVRLSADGKVAFYNKSGSVDLVADIVGYYDPAAAGQPGPKGDTGLTGPKGDKGDKGDTGNAGAPGGIPKAYVATSLGHSIDFGVEAQSSTIVEKTGMPGGAYIVRLDAELDTFNALWIIYNCKLQQLAFPALLGAPYTDIPGTRRHVSWRLGNLGNLGGSGVSITMQAAVTTPVTGFGSGLNVRMVCWSVWDTSEGSPPPLVDYGLGVTAATLTVLPVGGVA